MPLILRLGASFALAALILFSPSPLAAEGEQTGVIVGLVVDGEGSPLPGVDVTLDGPQTRRQAVSDDGGRFRFLQLPIGAYQVGGDLLGLAARARDVRVYIGKTTEVKLQLMESEGDAAPDPILDEITRDQIQVLAVAPLIDRFESGVRTSVSREFLEQLPVERFYQSVALLLPGVAGGDDGNPNTSGGLHSSNLFLVDGVDTTDPTTGLFGLNLSYDAVKDVDVTTAAPGVDTGRVSGATINVVTESGDNRFKGSARWFATNRSWNADIDAVPGLAREVAAANGDLGRGGTGELDNTFAATLAGPVVADNLWFFGVFEDGAESFTRPSFEGTVWNEDAGISSSAFKLNWQVGSQSLVGQFNSDDADFTVFSPFNRAPGENRAARTPGRLNREFLLPFPGDIFGLERRGQRGEFTKLEWNAVIGQHLSLTARGAVQDRSLTRSAFNRRDAAGAPHFAPTTFEVEFDEFGDPILFEDDFALFNGITDEGDENRERQQANLSGNYFLIAGETDHELNVGIDYQRTESDQLLTVAGLPGVDRVTGRPVDGQVFFDGDSRDACFFEEDCRPFDPQTGEFQPLFYLNFWQRPRQSTTQETLAIHASDSISFGRWLINAGLRFEMVEGEDQSGRALVDDSSLSPRLAVKYDAKGDGSVLLSAVYSRFVEPFPQRLLDDFVRLETFSGFTEYAWLGAFGVPECQFEDPNDLNNPCWDENLQQDFVTFQGAPPNLNLKRSSVEEIVLGFERQLTPNTALRLNLIDRQWRDLWDDTFELTPDFTIDAAVVNLPQAERSYRGFQLLVQRRFADGWQLLGSYTWSETEGNLFRSTGRDTFADFSQITDTNLVNRLGLAPYDRTHQFKIFATYRWDFARSSLALGGAMRYESGTPYQGERFENFGLRFLNPRGSLQLDDFSQIDLSLAYDLPITRTLELGVKLEVFNLADEQTVLAVENDVESDQFERPRDLSDLQAARNFRLTLALQF
ncbi:MAG: TonB-dependent receptor [Acidobacteriota bacterium]